MVCTYDDKNLTTGLSAHGITLAFTCCCSCALCGMCSGSWWSRCHWCRARFHHADAIPSVEFFPSGFCSPLVHFVVRLYSVIVNFICSQIIAHFSIAKTGHLRFCLYNDKEMAPGHVAGKTFPYRRTHCGTKVRWSRDQIKGSEGDA